MLAQRCQGVMNSWHILKEFPQRGGNSEILQWMESTIIQTSNHKDQGVPCQKEEGNQGRSPVASTRKPQANPLPQEGNKNKKNNWRKPYPQFTGFQKSKKMPWKMSSTWPEP
ncbi:hypothetical protein O181_052593 [Austropuccinia psidii MF-1]|uniref:Uncharacterized protein n=1 Tax=Austropuccinia psidii MF-1 TaxID=1389203 RepID=A0A9Q3E5T1_9BASI|nr:hypothetical protein [Austropuccinia psidii MF-1]